MAKRQIGSFKDRHFTFEVILWALRWYMAFPISYRDLAAMLSDCGVKVDHATLFRWVQAYAPTLETGLGGIYGRAADRGEWTYLYRAVNSLGQTIDFLLAVRRRFSASSARLCGSRTQ